MAESQGGAGVATDAPAHLFNERVAIFETHIRFFFRLAVPRAPLAESCEADGPDD